MNEQDGPRRSATYRTPANRRLAASAEIPESLRLTCASVPLQIEGPVDGGYIYFRARHGHWQLGIGINQDGAVDAALWGDEPRAFRGEDEDGAMSYGDEDRARLLIADHLPRLRMGFNRA